MRPASSARTAAQAPRASAYVRDAVRGQRRECVAEDAAQLLTAEASRIVLD